MKLMSGISTASEIVPFYGKGFDAIINDELKGLFAVFDGMGVSEGARFASSYLQKHFEEMVMGWSFEMMRAHLNLAQREIAKKPGAGSTATIVSVGQSGVLQYIHVGDSRLYVLHHTRVKQITADEGVENVLYNFVGDGGLGVFQLGYIEEWTKFMLCTDGVTGDREPDSLTDLVIEDILMLSSTPEQAVDSFLEISTKKDDKAVIVVQKEKA